MAKLFWLKLKIKVLQTQPENKYLFLQIIDFQQIMFILIRFNPIRALLHYA